MSENISFLVFWLDDRRYGVRIAQVERVVRACDCTPLPQAPQAVLGVIDFFGRIVPVLNIRDKFGMARAEVGLDDHFIIANACARCVALAVNGVSGVIDRPGGHVVAAENVLPGLEHVQGVIQHEDGLILIHDLDRFLSLDEARELEGALAGRLDHES